MNIAEIKIIFRDGGGAHPCIAVHGARQRNYYFYRPAESEKFQRVYTAGKTGEGIFPMDTAQDDLTDILAGKQGAFDVRFRTVEEVTQEREARDAERKRNEEVERETRERMAEAEKQTAALQKQMDKIRETAAEKQVAISEGIARAVNTEADAAKDTAPVPSPAPATVKRKKSPIPAE